MIGFSSIGFSGVGFSPLPGAAGGAANITERLCGVEIMAQTAVTYSMAVETSRLFEYMATCPAEHLLEISQSDLLAVSHQLQQAFAQNLITELMGAVTASKTVSVEQTRAISFSQPLPVEWTGAIVVEFTHGVAVEWTGASAHEKALAAEHILSREKTHAVQAETLRDNVTDLMLPVEWLGAVVAEFAQDMPVEWTAEFEDMKTLPTSSVAVILSEAALPAEQLAAIVAERNIPSEFVMNVVSSHILPVEWQGASGFVTGVSNIFKSFAGRGVRFAGRGRSVIFPKRPKRKG